jgi:hypothetical protein
MYPLVKQNLFHDCNIPERYVRLWFNPGLKGAVEPAVCVSTV